MSPHYVSPTNHHRRAYMAHCARYLTAGRLCVGLWFLSSAFSFNLAPLYKRCHFISCRHETSYLSLACYCNGCRSALELQVNSNSIAARQTKVVSTIILPFHVAVNEYCEHGNKKVKGHYLINNSEQYMEFPPLLEWPIQNPKPGLPDLHIGPFNHSASRMRYQYSNSKIACERYDDETRKKCGECRATLWSGGALDCVGGGGSRVILYLIQKLSLICRRSRRWIARLSWMFRNQAANKRLIVWLNPSLVLSIPNV
jgi:hypothetical protein